MTDSNLGEIIVVLDRSGSMASIASDMQGGFDRFIKERREEPWTTRVTLYQFDDQYECCYSGCLVADVPKLHLEPRGGTALLDAVGRAIQETGQRLAALPESKRPGSVVVMVITDGHENASHEYSKLQIRSMIKHQEEKYNWKFLYLGADAKAFDEAQQLGFSFRTTGKFQANAVGTRAIYSTTSQNYGAYRGSVTAGNLNADLNLNNAAEGLEVQK